MIKQNTPEWLELRKSYIGASDAPIIMGVSPFKTPKQLWEEKIGLSTNDFSSKATRHGKNLEEEARQSFERDTGLLVLPVVKLHSKKSFMMASLDGMDLEGQNIVELKCPYKIDDHMTAKCGNIPEKYYPQLQHQMAVCDLPMAYYYSYYDKKGVIVEVKRDDEYIEKLIEKEEEFFRCMEDMIPPQDSFMQREDDEWKEICAQYQYWNNQNNISKKHSDEYKEKLIQMAENKNCRGAGLKIQKIVSEGRVDYTLIPELKTLDLEYYKKPPSVSWRISNA